MPRRQSASAPVPKKYKTKNGNQKRSFNALAIAEQQNPVKSKVRSSRLGVLEENNAKRTRYGKKEDSEQEDQIDNTKKRRVVDKDRFGNEIEIGSDSDGNQWVIGQVDSNDDSELDSDEAMGEDDERKVEGFKAGNSSMAKSENAAQKKSRNAHLIVEHNHNIDLREDDDERESNEESDGFGDDAVDLAAILDESDDHREETSKFGVGEWIDPDTSNPGMEEPVVDGYGLSDEEESLLRDSETDDDIANPSKLTSLQTFVTNINKKDQNRSKYYDSFSNAQESLNPSEFGLSSKQKLTVTDLIPSVVDPRLKRSLKLLTDNESALPNKYRGIPKKLEVPLPKRQQDRLDRAAAYEKSKETLNRWIDTVKHNRRAEHLSFPLKNPNAAIAQGSQRLLSTIHSQPLTDLESAVQNILADSGIPSPGKDAEENQADTFKELPVNKISLQEVQARRAELRRARELLFREEARSKRIKKIKSKSYRRIHRKERERNAEHEAKALVAAGVDNSESENEHNDRRRAEERMGARHRESKWARGVKESGKAAWDVDARGGVTEMAKRGEDLRRRIAGREPDSVGDVSNSSESESDYEVGSRTQDQSQVLLEKKRRHLRVLDENGEGFGDIGTRTSNLSSMKFMINADALRKKKNDAEVKILRREITGEESPTDEDAEEAIGRRSYGLIEKTHALRENPHQEQRGELEEGDFSDTTDQHIFRSFEGKAREVIAVDAETTRDKISLKRSKRVCEYKENQGQYTKAPQPEILENPWLSGSNLKHKQRTQIFESTTIISNSLPARLDVAPDSDNNLRPSLKSVGGQKKVSNVIEVVETGPISKITEIDSEDENDIRSPFVMRNQDLVRKAFAGDEVVADFEKEKEEIMYEEEEKVVDNTLPGWGNWTGAGLSKKEQKRNKGRVLTKEAGIKRNERQDAKLDRVIINEKRFKKNAKYLASTLPHPFETRQQYERSLRLPVGPEWTTKETFQSATKPRIMMKKGIIAPMRKPII